MTKFMYYFNISILFLLFSLNCYAQKLISGPMQGYTEHFEVLIWLEVSKDTKKVELKYKKAESDEKLTTVSYQGTLGNNYNPLNFQLTHLEMGTAYDYEIWIDGRKETTISPLRFKTKKLWEWREPPPEFSFIIGSCAYVNDEKYDRPGDPYGQDYRIFETMAENPSDFMIWLGDNTYLREVDWSSESGIKYRYHRDRKLEELQPLLQSRHHYAIWDDHDYGPNNSNLSYELKDVALRTFRQYWGNQTYGEASNPGVYGNFTWGDAEFFLLDNRYYRAGNRYPDDSEYKSFLGRKQMEWLKNSLLSSRARFKFIVCGSQMLNLYNRDEAFSRYQKEFNELMEFLIDADIWGVVFLSGDRHFSEIIKRENSGFYDFYDITSSPLTAKPYSRILETSEGDNPDRVEGKIATVQNFIKISVGGKTRDYRKLEIQCFNIDNEELWNFNIDSDDLRPERNK